MCLSVPKKHDKIDHYKTRPQSDGREIALPGHEGHRARKKELFRTYGLDAFADHEALELLLYYAIPRRDTNLIAHRLMEHFGSLDAVFSAPEDELAKVDGVGENAATLLALILPLCRRVKTAPKKRDIILTSTARAGAYFVDLFFGVSREETYEACLDAKGKLISCVRVAEGGTDAVHFNMRRVVETALHCRASAVVLAHNHPSGVALPSPDDNTATLAAFDALRSVGIPLIDHIIVADGDFVSLRDNGLLPVR